MNVAFRVDADPQIGTGHFTRCLSLADRVRESGAAIRFVSRRLFPHLQAMLTTRGYGFTSIDGESSQPPGGLAHSAWLGTTQQDDAAATARALAAEACDWLIVDHYALDAHWEGAMRASASRILVIDDLADRSHDCDVLLDQNIDAGERYDGKVPPQCERLLGPRYALLREEFRAARLTAAPRSGPVTRALVSYGGADAANWTGVAIDALTSSRLRVPHVDVVIGDQHPQRPEIEASCRAHGFHCHVQPPGLAAMMAASDLAIGTGGVTMWERCSVGLPAVAFAAAANQRESLHYAAVAGLVHAMPGAPVTAPALGAHVATVAESPWLREMLSRNGLKAVDGEGTARVARAMGLDGFCFREATAADAAALLEWRNHESVRMQARRQEPVTPAEHHRWLQAVLSDANRVLLIGERNRQPAAVIRFDITGNEAEVSAYRVPGTEGPGVGTRAIRAAADWLRSRRPEITAIRAEVLGENDASHHMLRTSGYRLLTATYEKRLRP